MAWAARMDLKRTPAAGGRTRKACRANIILLFPGRRGRRQRPGGGAGAGVGGGAGRRRNTQLSPMRSVEELGVKVGCSAELALCSLSVSHCALWACSYGFTLLPRVFVRFMITRPIRPTE